MQNDRLETLVATFGQVLSDTLRVNARIARIVTLLVCMRWASHGISVSALSGGLCLAPSAWAIFDPRCWEGRLGKAGKTKKKN